VNSLEIETAVHLNLVFVIPVWNDSKYGLIKRGFRVESVNQLVPVLTEALQCDTVSVIGCPVDYAEN
jgi:acetolactate synthase-1/2/3 large subunit